MMIVSGFVTAIVLGTWVVLTGISEPREQRKERGKLGYKVLGTIIIHEKFDFGRPMEDMSHTLPHIPVHKTFPSVWDWKKSITRILSKWWWRISEITSFGSFYSLLCSNGIAEWNCQRFNKTSVISHCRTKDRKGQGFPPSISFL